MAYISFIVFVPRDCMPSIFSLERNRNYVGPMCRGAGISIIGGGGGGGADIHIFVFCPINFF
jgi:hypothetical protein